MSRAQLPADEDDHHRHALYRSALRLAFAQELPQRGPPDGEFPQTLM